MADLPPELIDAILARPDDDAVRLMAADWYIEQGDADRAEFIRIQCELAKVREANVRTKRPKNYSELTTREAELWQLHGNRWLAESELDTTIFSPVQFWRGFPAYLFGVAPIHWDTFAALLRRAPFLRFLAAQLTPPVPPDWLAHLLPCRDLRTVHLAMNRPPLEWDELQPLAQHPRLTDFNVANQGRSLISSANRRRLNSQREKNQEQSTDETGRLSDLRARLRNVIRSSVSGLDILSISHIPRQEINIARTLTTLRRVRLHRCNATNLRSLAQLPQIESLELFEYPAELPEILANCTQFRELHFYDHQVSYAPGLGEWLARQERLEILNIQMPIGTPGTVLRPLNQSRTLRVLMLLNWVDAGRLAGYQFPELRELSARIVPEEILERRSQFPKLETLSSLIPTSIESAQRLAQSNLFVPEYASMQAMLDLEPPIRSHPVELPLFGPNEPRPTTTPRRGAKAKSVADTAAEADTPMIAMQLPDGLEAIPDAKSPSATSGVVTLAGWREFGTTTEWPDCCMLHPTRIWLERIETPPGVLNARNWLTGPPTPFVGANWSQFYKVGESVRPEPRVLRWDSQEFSGIRAVWMGKQSVLRLIAEFSNRRMADWHRRILDLIASVRPPKVM